MGKIIKISDFKIKKLRDKLGCPKTVKKVEEFVELEYPKLDDRGREVLILMHRKICHLRGENLHPEQTIGRPGKVDRLLRGF